MNIFNVDSTLKTSLLHTLYDALKKVGDSSFSSVYHFEQISTQKDILEKMVYLIDQASKKFPNITPVQDLIETFPLVQEEVTTAISNQEGVTPAELVDLSTSTRLLLNMKKQNWAKGVTTAIKTQVDSMISSIPDSASTEKQALQAIQTTFTQLLANSEWSEQNYTTMYQTVESLISRIQNSILFSGDQKSNNLNQLSNILGDKNKFIQTFANIRAQALSNIITEAKKYLPEDESAVFQDLEATVNQFLSLTMFPDDDLNKLFQAFQDFCSLVEQTSMSSGHKVDLCTLAMDVYSDLMLALGMYDRLVSAIASNQELMQTLFATVSQWTNSVMGLMSPTNMGFIANLTPDLLLRALHLVRMIEQRFSELTSNQKQIINSCLEGLKTSGIVKYLGAAWAYLLASQTLAEKPDITISDLNTTIRNLATQTSPANSTFVLSQGLKSAVESVANNNGMFNPDNITKLYGDWVPIKARPLSFDMPLYQESSGKVSIDTEFFQSGSNSQFLLGAVTTLMKQHESDFLAKYNTFLTQQQTEISNLQTQVQQDEKKATEFQNLLQSYSENQVVLQKLGLQVYSLPGAFVSILVDHYMPKEVSYLDSLYRLLHFSNLGSEIGNAMIEATSTYIHGASYFNFGSFVGQQPVVGARQADEYPGSVESAKERLKLEKEQIQAYLKSTREAEKVITQQMDKVLKDTVISSQQRDELIGKLTSYSENVQVIANSLMLLQNFLQPLVVDNGSLPGMFKITGGKKDWRSQLELLENNLVSGLAGQMTGGLFTFQAFLQSEQQSYADMGQNHQLELQMHLTSMQQEWTLVATSLQLLNQMYLSLARSFLG